MKTKSIKLLLTIAAFGVATGALKAQTITIEARGVNSTWSTTVAGKNSTGGTVTWGTSTSKSTVSSAPSGNVFATTGSQNPTAANPLKWIVRPTLPSTGTWKVEITHTAATASANLSVNVVTTGGTGLSSPSSIFNSSSANVWENLGDLNATVTNPTIEFAYASGNALASGRWYLDTVRFTYVPPPGAVKTWTGGGADTKWSTSGNWSPSALAASGDDALFAGTTGLNSIMDGTYSITGLRFDAAAGAFDITRPGSETLTLANATSGITNNSSSLQTLHVPITMPTAGGGAIDVGAGGITVDGVLTAAGGFSKAGSGALTLQGGNNTALAGTVVVKAGSLTVAANDQIADTATIDLQSNNGTLALAASTSETIKRVSIGSLAASSPSGNINLGANAQLTMAPDSSFAGANSGSAVQINGGSGSVFTLRNGEFRLTPTNVVNTFEKLVVSNGGVLRIGHGGNAWLPRDAELGAVPASFLQDAITIDSAQLGINSSLTGIQDATNTVFINANRGMTIIGLATNETFQNVNFPGKITGTGTLVHNGGADLELGGANDYSGGLKVGSGSVTLANASAAGTGPIIFAANNGTLRAAPGNLTFPNKLDLSGFITNNFGGTNSYTVTGDVDVGNSGSSPWFNVTNAGVTVTLSGAVTNTLGVLKHGAGKLLLSGVNTYAGQTVISNGVLGINQVSSLGTNLVSLAGGTLNGETTMTLNQADRTITAISGGVAASAGAVLTINDPILGSGSLTIGGPGSVVINNGSGFTGALTVNGDLSGSDLPSGITTLAGSGTLNLGNASITLNGSANSTFSGSITGTGSITKTGVGILTLTGTNTFSGGITLADEGRINFNNTNGTAAGTGTITISSGIGRIFSTIPGAIVTNDIYIAADAMLYAVATSGNTLELRGKISGPGVLVRNNEGAGNVILSGDNDFTGGVTNSARGLVINHPHALGTGVFTIGDSTNTAAAPVAAITIHAGIDLTGANAVTNDIIVYNNFTFGNTNNATFSGIVTLSPVPSATLTNTVSSTNVTTLSGKVTGAVTLTKAGAGTLELVSGDNDYSGGTVVTAGLLKLSNTTGNAVGSGSVTVASGGSIGGNGVTANAIALSGKVAPGASAGTLTTGAETWNGGGSYTWELADATGTAGSGWDLLAVNGTLDVQATSGSKFTINVASLNGSVAGDAANFSSSTDYTWTIATTTGGILNFSPDSFNVVSTAFSNALPANARFLVETANAGNDLVVKYVRTPLITGPTGATVTAYDIVNFSVTVDGSGSFSYQWSKNGGNLTGQTTDTLSLGSVVVADSGSYAVRVANAYGTNTSSDAVLTVNPAGSTTTVSVSSATYDANPHGGSAGVTGAGGLSQSLTVTYSGRNATVYGPSTTAPTVAGDYTASASYAGDANHSASSDSQDYSINKASSSTTVTVSSATYDGSSHGGTANVTGVGGLNESLTVSYSGRNSTTYGPSTTAPTAAGDYTASATFGGDDNHNSSSDSKDFSISKASSTTTVTVSSATYDGNPHGGSADVTGAGGLNQSVAVSYSGRNSTTYGPSATAPTDAGDYTATATFAGDDDHNGSSDSDDYSIAQASLTVVADDKTRAVGDADPTFTGTVNGLVSGDDVTVSYNTTANVGSPAGDYPITPSLSGSDVPNYNATLTPGTLHVVGSLVVNVTPPSATKLQGESITFTNSASGGGTIGYVWQFNGTDISGATASTYTIANVSTNDQGTYTAIAYNEVNTNSAQSTLTVLGDSVKPILKVLSPLANFGYRTNAGLPSLTINGTAFDATRITSVQYDFNNAGYSNANLVFVGNLKPTNWNASITLTPGTNTLKVRTFDLAGNGVTNSLTFYYHTVSPLTIVINGTGSVLNAISPSLFVGNNTNLFVGRTYSLTTFIGAGTNQIGYVLTNVTYTAAGGQSGEIFVNSNALPKNVVKFMMRSNMVITFNFLDNPLLRHGGTYNGLFFNTNNVVDHDSAGYMSLIVSPKWVYSGKMYLHGNVVPVKGKLLIDGTGATTSSRVKLGYSDVSVNFAIDFATESDTLTGSVASAVDGWTSHLDADKFVWTTNVNETAEAWTNSYTLAIPGYGDKTQGPPGYGYVSTKVDLKGGIVPISGYLADGTVMKFTVTKVSKNGDWPFYASLQLTNRTVMYNSLPLPVKEGTTTVIGWLHFATNAPGSLAPTNLAPQGNLTWIKTGYTNLYTTLTNPAVAVTGSRLWIPPTAGTPFIDQTNLTMTFSDGDLVAPFTATNYTLTGLNTVKPPALATMKTNSTAITIAAKIGTITGSFIRPSTTTVVKHFGVVLQDYKYGRGFFLGTTEGGVTTLSFNP